MNMVAPGFRFVNLPMNHLPMNQCVTGLYVAIVSMMNTYLWDKPLIPCGVLQAHPMRSA
jgi:hypothetical protein